MPQAAVVRGRTEKVFVWNKRRESLLFLFGINNAAAEQAASAEGEPRTGEGDACVSVDHVDNTPQNALDRCLRSLEQPEMKMPPPGSHVASYVLGHSGACCCRLQHETPSPCV